MHGESGMFEFVNVTAERVYGGRSSGDLAMDREMRKAMELETRYEDSGAL